MRQKTPEERKAIIENLEKELKLARDKGEDSLSKAINYKIRYQQKLIEGGARPVVNPDGTVAPAPAVSEFPDVKVLMKEAGKVAGYIKEGISGLSQSASVASGKRIELQASDLSILLLSIGFCLSRRRINPQTLEKMDLYILGAGGGLFLLENWRQFAGNTQDSGGRAEPVGKDGSGVGQHPSNEKPVDTQSIS